MTSPARAFTNPSTGERVYYGIDPSDRFAGVTTILGALPRQIFLMPWTARIVAENAIEIMMQMKDGDTSTLWAYTHEDGEIDWELLASDLKETWKWERDDAGTLGDEVHELAESLLNISGGKYSIYSEILEQEWMKNNVSCKAYNRLLRLGDFLRDNDVVVERTEFTVYNDTHGYAGTCDLAAYVNSIPSFIDIKTGKVHEEAAMQLSAYSNGEYIIANDLQEPMPFAGINKNDIAGGVLNLMDTKCKYIEVDISDEIFDCFLSLMLVKRLWLDGGLKEAIGKTLYESKKKKGGGNGKG